MQARGVDVLFRKHLLRTNQDAIQERQLSN